MQLAEAAKGDNPPLPKLEEITTETIPQLSGTYSLRSLLMSLPRMETVGPRDQTLNQSPQPFSTKVYPMSPIEQKELYDFLEENLLKWVGSTLPSLRWLPQSSS